VNLGIQKLRAAVPGATIAEIATSLEIDRTYCGRILADDRTPGLAVRKRARDLYGVDLDDWDQKLPDPKPGNENANPNVVDS